MRVCVKISYRYAARPLVVELCLPAGQCPADTPISMEQDGRPPAKRVRHNELQAASNTESNAVASHTEGSLYQTDATHLEGLDSTFAGSANGILCAKDSDRTIGFPVHRHIIAPYCANSWWSLTCPPAVQRNYPWQTTALQQFEQFWH